MVGEWDWGRDGGFRYGIMREYASIACERFSPDYASVSGSHH